MACSYFSSKLSLLASLLAVGVLVNAEEYREQFAKARNALPSLLEQDYPGGPSKLLNAFIELAANPITNLTISEQDTLRQWVKSVEQTTISNTTLSVEQRIVGVAEEVLSLRRSHAVLYGKMAFLALPGWNVVADLVEVGAELQFPLVRRLTVPRPSGSCDLFPILLRATQLHVPELVPTVTAFLEHDLLPIVSNKSNTHAEIVAAIHNHIRAVLLPTHPRHRLRLLAMPLAPLGSLDLFLQAAKAFALKHSVPRYLNHEGEANPMIRNLQFLLKRPNVSLSQKSQAKRFASILQREFVPGQSIDERLTILSTQFTDFVRFSPSSFPMLANVPVNGMGILYDLIILSCHSDPEQVWLPSTVTTLQTPNPIPLHEEEPVSVFAPVSSSSSSADSVNAGTSLQPRPEAPARVYPARVFPKGRRSGHRRPQAIPMAAAVPLPLGATERAVATTATASPKFVGSAEAAMETTASGAPSTTTTDAQIETRSEFKPTTWATRVPVGAQQTPSRPAGYKLGLKKKLDYLLDAKDLF